MDISIIIPFYNGNEYITNCVNSVMESYRYAIQKKLYISIEVIIINDSPQIDPHLDFRFDEAIKIFVKTNEKNVGIQKSRINGINYAGGTYIWMLDQDDVLEKEAIFSNYNMTREYNCDVVVGNGYIERDDGTKYLNFSSFYSGKAFSMNIWSHIFLGNQVTSPGQVLIKKSCIPQYWLQHPIYQNGADDALLWMMLFLENINIKYNHCVVYRHVFTGENTSNNKTGMYLSLVECYQILKNMKKINGLCLYMLKKHIILMGVKCQALGKINLCNVCDYLFIRLLFLIVRKILGKL